MHELSLCTEMVRTLENLMDEEGLHKIQKIKLQVGEVTGVLPRFMQDCWGPASEGTRLEGAKLEIEYLPSSARCPKCGEVFHPEHGQTTCPKCGCKDCPIEKGFEFEITEITGE